MIRHRPHHLDTIKITKSIDLTQQLIRSSAGIESNLFHNKSIRLACRSFVEPAFGGGAVNLSPPIALLVTLQVAHSYNCERWLAAMQFLKTFSRRFGLAQNGTGQVISGEQLLGRLPNRSVQPKSINFTFTLSLQQPTICFVPSFLVNHTVSVPFKGPLHIIATLLSHLQHKVIRRVPVVVGFIVQTKHLLCLLYHFDRLFGIADDMFPPITGRFAKRFNDGSSVILQAFIGRKQYLAISQLGAIQSFQTCHDRILTIQGPT
mmetsp:Transcript_4068/g.9412  ORF Transcript_4068/g.9412 Transcript_4068/m.9412 type:complete len:262 (+) Transcript_4068:2131-2916(+)